MKKRSFFTNLTLMLVCLCLVAYGVYSAKNATLTISGQIGFTAHNINVTVAVTEITGAYDITYATEYGASNLKNTSVTLDNMSANLLLCAKDEADVNAQLPLYFNDIIETEDEYYNPIEITFTVTNNSAWEGKIKKVNNAVLSGSNADNSSSATDIIKWRFEISSGNNSMSANGGTMSFKLIFKILKSVQPTSLSDLIIPVEFGRAI